MADRIAWAILALVVVLCYAWAYARLEGMPPMDVYGPVDASGHVTAD